MKWLRVIKYLSSAYLASSCPSMLQRSQAACLTFSQQRADLSYNLPRCVIHFWWLLYNQFASLSSLEIELTDITMWESHDCGPDYNVRGWIIVASNLWCQQCILTWAPSVSPGRMMGIRQTWRKIIALSFDRQSTAAQHFKYSRTVRTTSRQMKKREQRSEIEKDRRRQVGSGGDGERAMWNSYKILCEGKCNSTGRVEEEIEDLQNRKLRLPSVHTRYKLLMRALNKWVQCTGRGRWLAQCESPQITSKNGLVPEWPEVAECTHAWTPDTSSRSWFIKTSSGHVQTHFSLTLAASANVIKQRVQCVL